MKFSCGIAQLFGTLQWVKKKAVTASALSPARQLTVVMEQTISIGLL